MLIVKLLVFTVVCVPTSVTILVAVVATVLCFANVSAIAATLILLLFPRMCALSFCLLKLIFFVGGVGSDAAFLSAYSGYSFLKIPRRHARVK